METTIQPLFTRENAALFGSKGGKISQERQKERKEAFQRMLEAPKPAPVDQQLEARKATAAKDLDKLQLMIDDCEKPDVLLKLLTAKEKVWKLLFASPKSSRSRRDFTPAEPDQPDQPGQ